MPNNLQKNTQTGSGSRAASGMNTLHIGTLYVHRELYITSTNTVESDETLTRQSAPYKDAVTIFQPNYAVGVTSFKIHHHKKIRRPSSITNTRKN